jgi:hypothetical protein
MPLRWRLIYARRAMERMTALPDFLLARPELLWLAEIGFSA